ncbi:c-type cytochrome [Halovulum sp. GXIMD14794]
MHFKWMLAMACVAALPIAPAAQAQGVDELLATADPAAGEKAFRQCKACHTVEEGGASRVGPNLWSVVGRDVASADDFKYSKQLQDYGGSWTVERLDAFLENPRDAVPGTRMSFRGIKDAADRADMIAYLNANSSAPLELASAEAGDEATEAPASAEEDFGLLVNEPGVEETFYACTACHSEMIVVQQGKSRENWDKLFDWMVEEQGMAELPEDEREVILDYLAAHYNTDRPNFPQR